MKFSQMLIAFAVVSFVCVQAKYQKDGNDTVSATLAARNAFFARRAEAYDELDHEIQGTCATNCVSNIIDAVQKNLGTYQRLFISTHSTKSAISKQKSVRFVNNRWQVNKINSEPF
eukprot:258642_1